MKPSFDLSETGYLSQAFGHAFDRLGRVITLPDSGLQLLERPIAGGHSDLLGLYPYAMCRDFAALTGAADQAALQATGAVALSFVTDPFALDVARVALVDWDLCRRFKTHFVIDLKTDWRGMRAKKTRYYVRRGYKTQTARTITTDAQVHAADFWALYAPAMQRLGAKGIQKMSPQMIAAQLAVPGVYLTLTHAREGGALTGALISYAHGDQANTHLLCYDLGDDTADTSYVLTDAAAAHAETLGCHWFNIGGPAGMHDDPSDGLYAFKKRWTPHTREALLCGQVLNRDVYNSLCTQSGTENAEFFPAYRAPGSPLEWQPDL